MSISIIHDDKPMKRQTILQRSQGILSALSNCMPDFETRDAQTDLISQIAHITQNSLDKNTPNHVIAECPTGSGKSLSSLIPAKAFLDHLAAEHIDDVKVIYATATVSLQTQLLNDIDLLRNAGISIKSHVAVGRARFMCKKHAENIINEGQTAQEALSFADGIEDNVELPSESTNEFDKRKIKTLFTALEDGSWSGMKDDLSEAMSVNAKLWDKLKSDSNTCSPRCKYHSASECPFVENRQKMSEADIVVTNHSMLFTDLDHGRVLPPANKSLIIVDEGHKAFENFAKQQEVCMPMNKMLALTNKQSMHVINGISVLYTANKTTPEVSQQKLQSTFGELQKDLQDFTRMLESSYKHATQHKSRYEKDQGVWEMEVGDVHRYSMATTMGNIKSLIGSLHGWMSLAIDVGKKGKQDDVLDRIMATISNEIKTIEEAKATMEFFLNPEQNAPVALWCKSSDDGSGNLSLNGARVDMSQLMREKFWDQTKHCVLMSATLRVGGNFNRLCRQMGVDESVAYVTALPSPFEEAYHHSTLHLYPSMVEPNWQQTAIHSQQIASHTAGFMSYHDAGLLLVNSKKQLDEIVSMLPTDIQDIALIQGGSVSRQTLIKQHIERVRQGNKSLLIGMASFAEGLDLKGNLLTFVGISKLNFGHSSDPRTNAEAAHIKKLGGNPFEELILPETEKYLQQSVGRLIRSIKDRGEIAIFDSRLATKRYGSSLLNGLPNFYKQNNSQRYRA